MFDGALVHSILLQIDEAIEKIRDRTSEAESADYFTGSPAGMERLDGIAMLFIAIGESLKNLDKITEGVPFFRAPGNRLGRSERIQGYHCPPLF